MDFTKLYRVGGLLLDCACAKLQLTETGCPDRRCIVPGIEPEAVNCCHPGGQLTVNVVRTYPSRQFPVPDLGTPNNCDAPYQVATFNVTVFRCMPVGSVEHPPSCAKLDDTALVVLSDMEAVRQGVVCCLRDRDTLMPTLGDAYVWGLGDHLPVGPEGGCVGTNLTVLVGLPTCWDCG